jgi:SAM-dependent methyltransferase
MHVRKIMGLDLQQKYIVKIDSKIMFNRLLTENDISVFAEIIQRENYSEKFKHKDLWNIPAGFVKWVSVLEEFKSIGKNNLKVIDLGTSTGVVPYIIASLGNNVTGIDIHYFDNWCPKNLIRMVIGDALLELKEMEDGSVDVVTDLCAVHEFNPNSNSKYKNIGLKEVSDQIYRVLKPGGKFLMSTDVSLVYPASQSGGFILPEDVIEIVETTGLRLTCPYKKEYEQSEHNPIYQSGIGLHIATFSFEK